VSRGILGAAMPGVINIKNGHQNIENGLNDRTLEQVIFFF
jgi:hypothetical protein